MGYTVPIIPNQWSNYMHNVVLMLISQWTACLWVVRWRSIDTKTSNTKTSTIHIPTQTAKGKHPCFKLFLELVSAEWDPKKISFFLMQTIRNSLTCSSFVFRIFTTSNYQKINALTIFLPNFLIVHEFVYGVYV